MTECAVGDPTITVNLSWGTGETAGELVLPPECPGAGGAWWNTLALPEWELRYTYAPPSEFVPGNVLLGAVEDSGAVVLGIAVRGTSLADLEARKVTIREALSAWPGEFLATADEGDGPVTIGGPWQTFPTLPRWGTVTPQRAGLYVAETTVSIPVNPAGAP
jgi:hypothetical protein